MSKMLGNLSFAITIMLCSVIPCISAKIPVRVIDGTVTKVSDGDTIQVTDHLGTKVKVRFYGMDAPETPKVNRQTGIVNKPGQPFGQEAEAVLRTKIYNQRVRLQVMDVDRYKRLVSIVWLGNRNINIEMVSEGWGWAYRQYLGGSYVHEFIQAETSAKRARRGLWQQLNPQSPADFRKALKIRGAGDYY